jgi:hypothetical protein
LRDFGIIAVLALALAFAAVPTLAVTDFTNAPSGAHYRQDFAEPLCTSTTTPTTGAITVSCTNTVIGGVENTKADLLLEMTSTADFVCHNLGNDDIVEPHSASVDESVEATLVPSRNGQLIVSARSVRISPEEAAEQFECPNPNWREEFTGFSDLGFTYSLTLVGLDQPAILIEG